MKKLYIPLDDSSEKKHIRILMIIFGIICILTSGWWAVFMIKNPENESVFWLATIFLFLFGSYQIYSGMGYAKRYISIDGQEIKIRQNGFLKAKHFIAGDLEKIEIGSMDIIFRHKLEKRFRLKLGLKYPDLGQNIKDQVVTYCGDNEVEIFYNNVVL